MYLRSGSLCCGAQGSPERSGRVLEDGDRRITHDYDLVITSLSQCDAGLICSGNRIACNGSLRKWEGLRLQLCNLLITHDAGVFGSEFEEGKRKNAGQKVGHLKNKKQNIKRGICFQKNLYISVQCQQWALNESAFKCLIRNNVVPCGSSIKIANYWKTRASVLLLLLELRTILLFKWTILLHDMAFWEFLLLPGRSCDSCCPVPGNLIVGASASSVTKCSNWSPLHPSTSRSSETSAFLSFPTWGAASSRQMAKCYICPQAREMCTSRRLINVVP